MNKKALRKVEFKPTNGMKMTGYFHRWHTKNEILYAVCEDETGRIFYSYPMDVRFLEEPLQAEVA